MLSSCFCSPIRIGTSRRLVVSKLFGKVKALKCLITTCLHTLSTPSGLHYWPRERPLDREREPGVRALYLAVIQLYLDSYRVRSTDLTNREVSHLSYLRETAPFSYTRPRPTGTSSPLQVPPKLKRLTGALVVLFHSSTPRGVGGGTLLFLGSGISQAACGMSVHIGSWHDR